MKLKNFTMVVLLCVLALPVSAGAIDLNPIKIFANNAGLSPYDDFQSVLLVVLNAFLAISFIVAVVFIVLSGFRLITSGGNEKRVEDAKRNLLWAIIGIVVIVLSYAILTLIVDVVRTGNVGNTD